MMANANRGENFNTMAKIVVQNIKNYPKAFKIDKKKMLTSNKKD